MSQLPKIVSTNFILIVGYPIMAAFIGAIGGVAIAVGIPSEPHPVLYGVGTGVAFAAYAYFRTWLDFRKARRQKQV